MQKIERDRKLEHDSLREIEKELVLAMGCSLDVPEWARPTIKYFRQPAAHVLNLTIADFPPADAPNAIERYNAWLEKKQDEEYKNELSREIIGSYRRK